MRILILGGTGFIGHNMLEHFVKLGHEVLATHFKADTYKFIGGSWVGLGGQDLRKPGLIDSIIKATKPDIIIQAAATTSGSKDIVNNPALHVTDNAIMNALIFRAAAVAKVKHVIFFSCTTMFSNGVVTEESPIDIHPKYFGIAHTKLYNEKMCEFYSGPETKFTVIRHSNIYGPHDKFDLEKSHVFGATVTKVMREAEWRAEWGKDGITKGKVTVWGTGEEARDLLYVSDLCDFVQAAIEKQKTPFEIYNCGYGMAFKVIDLVKKIIEASGKNLSIEHDMTAPTIPTSLSLNCDKARAQLGWWPKVTLTDGIKLTLEWWKNAYRP